MSNKFSRPMEVRPVKLKLDDGSILTGKINLHSEYAEGAVDSYSDDYSADAGLFYNRVSDLFSKGKNSFIIVFEVKGNGFGDEGPLIINKRKILWVSPQD